MCVCPRHTGRLILFSVTYTYKQPAAFCRANLGTGYGTDHAQDIKFAKGTTTLAFKVPGKTHKLFTSLGSRVASPRTACGFLLSSFSVVLGLSYTRSDSLVGDNMLHVALVEFVLQAVVTADYHRRNLLGPAWGSWPSVSVGRLRV